MKKSLLLTALVFLISSAASASSVVCFSVEDTSTGRVTAPLTSRVADASMPNRLLFSGEGEKYKFEAIVDLTTNIMMPIIQLKDGSMNVSSAETVLKPVDVDGLPVPGSWLNYGIGNKRAFVGCGIAVTTQVSK